MAVYIVIAVLVSVLAVATVAAAILGILGLLGIVRFARCRCCGRLTVTDARTSPQSCPQCRHEYLTHPLAGMHHLHSRLPMLHLPSAKR
jgi:predicted Zn-ribbon and HTH transcriptional regulator